MAIKRLCKQVMIPLCALGLLTAMGVVSLTKATPVDAEPYHLRVRQAVQAMPRVIGPWEGTDREAPPAAIKLLRPNVLFNRVYRNKQTGRTATLLLVHCKDARDLAGHYPPICYPANGWKLDEAQSQTWRIGNLTIASKEYRFSFFRIDEDRRIVVQNFMIMPDGQFFADMKGVRQAAADYTRHFYGAAQIQMVTDASIGEDERLAIFRTLMGANQAVIEVLRSGVKQ